MNDVQMKELIEAIEKLSQKGWVDYLIIIVPIMLSVIAVWISLATASKQNKIALFEKRFKALLQLEKAAAFEEGIYESNDAELFVELFDLIYGTNLHRYLEQEDSLMAIKEVGKQMLAIRSDVAALSFTFGENNHELFENIIDSMEEVVVDAIDGKIDLKGKKSLHQACERFGTDIYPKLFEKIKI